MKNITFHEEDRTLNFAHSSCNCSKLVKTILNKNNARATIQDYNMIMQIPRFIPLVELFSFRIWIEDLAYAAKWEACKDWNNSKLLWNSIEKEEGRESKSISDHNIRKVEE